MGRIFHIAAEPTGRRTRYDYSEICTHQNMCQFIGAIKKAGQCPAFFILLYYSSVELSAPGGDATEAKHGQEHRNQTPL